MANLSPPIHSDEVKVVFPAPHVLLLAFNRPKSLNAMTPTMQNDMKKLLDWFEDEPELWCVFTFVLIRLIGNVLGEAFARRSLATGLQVE